MNISELFKGAIIKIPSFDGILIVKNIINEHWIGVQYLSQTVEVTDILNKGIHVKDIIPVEITRELVDAHINKNAYEWVDAYIEHNHKSKRLQVTPTADLVEINSLEDYWVYETDSSEIIIKYMHELQYLMNMRIY